MLIKILMENHDIMRKDKNLIRKSRLEVLKAAEKYGISEASRMFNISRPTITNWRKRYQEKGISGLDNLSKKHLPYPNRLPEAVSQKIISTKKENPDISASEIKKRLQLSCSLTTVLKKLDSAGLLKKSKFQDINFKKIPQKIKPLENIFITIRKNQDLKNENLPAYFIIAVDYKTGLIFLGYAFKNIDLTLSIFIDYLLENFQDLGLKTENISFIPLRKSLLKNFQKKDSVSNKIITNFKAKIKILDDSLLQKCRRAVSASGILNFLKYNKFNSAEELLGKSFSFLLGKNFQICDDKKRYRNINNQICKLSPVIVDRYISQIDLLKKSSLLFEYKKTLGVSELLCISQLRQAGYSHKKLYQNKLALDCFKKVLYLTDIKKEYFEILIDTLLEKGRILEYTGCYQRAENCYKSALELSEKEKRENITVKCFRYFAAYYRTTGNYKESLKYYKQMLSIAEQLNVAIEIIIATRNLGNILFYQSNYKAALEKYRQSLLKSQETGDFIGIAKAYIGFSLCAIQRGDNVSSGNYLKKAEKISLEINNKRILMVAFADYGHYYLNNNDFPFRYLEKFIQYATETNDKEIKMLFFKQMGNISITQSEYREGIKYLKKGLLLAEETQHSFNVGKFLYNIGISYLGQDKITVALKYFKDCLKLAEKKKFKKLIISSVVNLGAVSSILKKNEEAQNFLERALLLMTKSKNEILILVVYFNLSILAIRRKEYDKALNYLKKQLRIAKRLKFIYEMITAYGFSGIAYREMGKYQTAEHNLRKAIQIARENDETEELILFRYEKAQLYELMKRKTSLLKISPEIKNNLTKITDLKLKKGIIKMFKRWNK